MFVSVFWHVYILRRTYLCTFALTCFRIYIFNQKMSYIKLYLLPFNKLNDKREPPQGPLSVINRVLFAYVSLA